MKHTHYTTDNTKTYGITQGSTVELYVFEWSTLVVGGERGRVKKLA